MRKLLKEFENRKIEYNKLIDYGFILDKEVYIYRRLICDGEFEVKIEINNNLVLTSVIEIEFNEEYILVDILNSQGNFVGKVKDEYESVINDFISQCTVIHIFKSNQANVVINYVKEKYNDELEYLWKKFPNNAIWRNKKNNKWYGAILTITANKIGLDSLQKIEILDLRYASNLIEQIVDNVKIFSGYHMNKKNWITIKLDGSVDDKYLFELIDGSFNLSNNLSK